MDRRQFLRIGGFVTASVVGVGLAACAGGDDVNTGNCESACGPGWKFPQSVASGDPQPDAIMLWTRVVPAGAGDVASCDAGDFTIRLRITDANHDAVLGSNAALSGGTVLDTPVAVQAIFDHTVRHRVSGLAPSTLYYYQFVAGDVHSNVGRFKTAPARSAAPAQLRFAVLACQDWSINHWGAFDDVAGQELDFVLHLGDYIYETVGEWFQAGPVEARHAPLSLPDGSHGNGAAGASRATTLADYRYLYKQYRSDARLQAVHERFAMVAIWDDHEFSNDCWRDAATDGDGSGDHSRQPGRRRSANQAWYEYMPADIHFSADPAAGIDNVRIYRDLQFGRLAHLVLTDERLYRSAHALPEAAPCSVSAAPLGGIGSRSMVPEALLHAAEARKMAAARAAGEHPLTPVSMLSNAQREWWQQTMKDSPALWKLWGNEVSLLRMGLDGSRAIGTLQSADSAEALVLFSQRFLLSADQWDGYDAERKALMQHLKDHGIRNVVALSGDIHAFFAGEVRDDYRATSGGSPVMVDLVTAGISSDSLFVYLKKAVGSLSAGLVPLVYQTLRVPLPGAGTLELSVNLLDYTLGAPTPTAATLAERLRVPLRGALAQAGLPEARLDATTASVLEGLQSDADFTGRLLALARGLAALHSNPWLKLANTDAQGYAVVTVTAAALRCEFRQVNKLVGDAAPATVVARTTVATVPRDSTEVSIA
ncbi:alkaline phosphatase D family protein [Comamonas endophytica]|uniref:Alkaline phosphatase D family protein n=1 Tax=Comamonas endophytica TaxID=2949090 RepID=A0ABY6G832_9BURK|nr:MULTISPECIES: alkaline phosphatase D family protein [unclassified Acidovorax]MCD2514050.1 alkaline phosphatase D family protein [Acidovorax sp. D4N7]UYG51193.1 alkaline phosphatase D family protein [Acidovorax sp. 5MLIR]